MGLPAFADAFEQVSILPPSIGLDDLLDMRRSIQDIDQRILGAEDQLAEWVSDITRSIEQFHRVLQQSDVPEMQAIRRDWQEKLEGLVPQIDDIAEPFHIPFAKQRQVARGLKMLRANPPVYRGFMERLNKMEGLREKYLHAYQRFVLEVRALIAELDPEARPNGVVVSTADELIAHLRSIR